MQVITTFDIDSWHNKFSPQEQSEAIAALEGGKLLLLPKLPFQLLTKEKRFLSPLFADSKAKNISYNRHTGLVKGITGTREDHKEITLMLSRFSQQAQDLIIALFPNYQDALQVGRTSFRPVQVSTRNMSYRKDDKRLHVDAFPATPNQGRRILRVFSNINPYGESRVWRIGEAFETVASQFIERIPTYNAFLCRWLHRLRLTKTPRTEYDHMMLHLHNTMKKNQHYQQQAKQVELHLPPGSTWIVQTDVVSHAAMSGQYLLEQTFYLPVSAMLDPQRSPLKILERLKGKVLA